MKQTVLLLRNKMIIEAKMIKEYGLIVTNKTVNSALLAKANRPLSRTLRGVGVIILIFKRKDCFECLSPHKNAA